MRDVAGTAVTTAPSAPSQRRVESRAGTASSPSTFSHLRCQQGSPLSGSVMFALRVRVLEWIYIDVDMKNAHPMIVTAAPSATSQRRAESRAGSGSSSSTSPHLLCQQWFARGRQGARRWRALAKAHSSPVCSTTSSASLSASRAHRVRHRRRNTDGGASAKPPRLLRGCAGTAGRCRRGAGTRRNRGVRMHADEHTNTR